MEKSSNKAKLALIVIASLLITIIGTFAIYTGIKCAIDNKSPKEEIVSMFATNETKIVGKWQDIDEEGNIQGIVAYEFSDDGTCRIHYFDYSYQRDYTVNGKTLRISDPDSDTTVEYEITLANDTLTMNCVSRNGLDEDQEGTGKYKKVNRINNKSIDDFLYS